MDSDSSAEEDSSFQASQEEEDEREEVNLIEIGDRVAKHLMQAFSLGIVCKKSELLRLCERQRKYWPQIKLRAEQLIKHVFGYKLREVPNDKETLVFVVEAETIGGAADHIDEDIRLQKVFLFIVLGFLTLKGPPVTEGQIMDFLRKLGIDSGETCFGSVNDLLTTKLTSQYYLKRTKEDNSGTGEVCYRYDWGPRSIAEVDKEQLLNKFSSILGKPVRSFVQMDNNANART